MDLGSTVHDPRYLFLLDSLLAVFVGYDLVWSLRTGRARGRFGTITRANQPRRFRRYIYGSYAVLAFCTGVAAWTLIWPETLR